MLITIFTLIVLFFSIVIHEIAHGSVALHLGDSTAKDAGRLSLNPLKHIDPLGSILLPLILILSYSVSGVTGPVVGWAKPVPINPFNFRDQKWGILKVSIAGPSMNFLLALIFGLIIRFFPLPQPLLVLFSIITLYNFLWGIFNLVPIPPLDGYHILFTFLPESLSGIKLFLKQYSLFILILLLFFGLDWIFKAAIAIFTLVSGQSLVI
jgi:Zn-dependent protease